MGEAQYLFKIIMSHGF